VKIGSITVVTDQNGNYSLRDVPAGNQQVTAAKEGYFDYLGAFAVAAGVTTIKDIEMTLTTGTVTGIVRDSSSGAAIAGATVSIESISTTSDANGEYTLNGVLWGEKTIKSVKAGYFDYSDKVAVVGGGTVTKEIDMIFILFTSTRTYETGAGPHAVVATDFFNNGSIDLAVANTDANNVMILPGDGKGGFGSPVTFNVGSTPYSLAVGDFNSDGINDLAAANFDTAQVTVLLSDNETDTYNKTVIVPAGGKPTSLVPGDFNKDGIMDLAVACQTDFNTTDRKSGAYVLLGNGSGNFPTVKNVDARTGTCAVETGDFNRDGKADLVYSSNVSNAAYYLPGKGDGTFDYTGIKELPAGSNPCSIAVGDVNGDGNLDMAVANYNDDTVSVYISNGNGTFNAPLTSSTGAGTKPASIDMGDLNDDGKTDIAVACYGTNQMMVLTGNGAGAFGFAAYYAAGTGPVDITISDLKATGELDIVTANSGSRTLSVFFQH
jgi:hypothetical protein